MRKDVNHVMDEKELSQQQNQLLMMPWMALSDQIKMTNQRIDDLRGELTSFKDDVNKRFDLMDKRFESIEEKLDKRVDRAVVIFSTIAGIMATFFVTYITMR
ncbi:hypothetical protein SAMN05443507_12911 [Alicyclobacillus tolerans]|uniref:Haemolysin XhlA n=2 Tax=Alicyclobacillus tolerans TaxID=90970 RepID=A0A1M6WQM2_9BACL|nr:hypothetical protein SAMN05443507_12911 [Alicyclobacillus montanus]